jgi:hypothetical protein
MLVVETIAKIRRAYFIQRKPIKQICRELRVSVKRGEAEFSRNIQADPLGPMRSILEAGQNVSPQDATTLTLRHVERTHQKLR